MCSESMQMKCRLCELERQLRNSHIIPEFVYKPIYEKHRVHQDKHRAYEIFIDSDSQFISRVKPIQKGLREKLLCHDCEQLLNDRYEKYFLKVWFENKSLPGRVSKDSIIHISGLDYHKFKMFHLSILFRASASSLPEFRQVSLGVHENRIRKKLLDDESGDDTEDVIIAHAITKENGEIQFNLITSPFLLRQLYGYISYGFCFGGCVWYYIVDTRRVTGFSEFMLKSDGTMSLSAMKFDDFFRQG